MATYSTLESNAQTSLQNATDGGLAEEYQIGRRRVRRGKTKDQVETLALLEGLANRRGGSMFRLSKLRVPRA